MSHMIDGHRVVRQLSIKEAEAEHSVNIDGEEVPFGYNNSRWRSLLRNMAEDDELWLASSAQEDWERLRGFEGILLVRDGKAIDSFVTFLN